MYRNVWKDTLIHRSEDLNLLESVVTRGFAPAQNLCPPRTCRALSVAKNLEV